MQFISYHRLITDKSFSDISQEEMQEIRSSFFKFDEDKSQRLEYAEFKRCLRILGFDVGPEDQETDPKFQAILDIIDLDRFVFILALLPWIF